MYKVYNLDAFSTPQLRKDLESMKTDWLKTKLELEEAQVSSRSLEGALSDEKALCSKKLEELESAQHGQLAARDTKHSCVLAELVARHEAQLSDFEKRLQDQLQEMQSRFESELSHVEQIHLKKLEDRMREEKNLILKLQAESSERENQLRSRLSSLEEEYPGLKSHSRKLMDSMQQDKNTKLQATAGRCKELQDEVESLRTVLDLRHEELQDLRKQNAVLIREAEELPVALQKVAALEAKVEDLREQLEKKTSIERQLSQDNRLLMESFHQESNQNKRLSLHNEELQWKLKKNIEVINALTALSGATMNSSMTSYMHNSTPNGRSMSQSLNEVDISGVGNQLFNSRIPPRPLSAGRSNTTSDSDLSSSPAPAVRSVQMDDLEFSPPGSPKVKGIVEKRHSVSWVVEIDETPEAFLSRLVRRAGSFRGTTPPPPSVPSPAHKRTFPPPKRQRCKASSLSLSSSTRTIKRSSVANQSRNTPFTSSLCSRSRSVSTDSEEGIGLDYSSWAPTTSSPIQGPVTNGALKIQTTECSNDASIKISRT